MSDEEPWDAKKVAAECAATARAKTGTAPLRPGEPPPIPITSIEQPSAADEYRDELGKFKEGNPYGGVGAGPPTKYKPEYVDQAHRLAQIGATNVEMAEFFEVAPSTFMLWRNIHPEFNEAVKIGKDKANDRTERSLYEIANGYDYVEETPMKLRDADGNERVEIVRVKKHQPPDSRAVALFLTNRRPTEWQVKRTIEHTPGQPALTPAEQRKALLEFYQGGEIIDVTPTRLPALPESENVTKEDTDF